jgi:hypothetical protein
LLHLKPPVIKKVFFNTEEDLTLKSKKNQMIIEYKTILLSMRRFLYIIQVQILTKNVNLRILCINTGILITEMGVSNKAKNFIPLKFLRKIKNKKCFSLVNSIRGHIVNSFYYLHADLTSIKPPKVAQVLT